jgi:Ca-activated chloride channel family protein
MFKAWLQALSDFHLMRPAWLWLMPLALWIFWLLKKRTEASDWPSFIAPHLVPFLLSDPNQAAVSQNTRHNFLPTLWLLASTLCLIALSGPAWQKLPQPVEERMNALVVVLDLSLSMTATDVTPSRIARARFKVQDLLMQREEGLTGLVVYAGDAHTVVPLTQDTRTIEALLPSLTPWIMPIKGSRPDLAIAQAAKALEGGMRGFTQNGGHIILISDTLAPDDIADVKSQLKDTAHRVSILAIGTPEGAPITLPNGQYLKDNQGHLVLPKLDLDAMARFAQGINATLIPMSNTDNDIKLLLRNTPSSPLGSQNSTSTEKTMKSTQDVWRDEAFWLVWLLLPVGAALFRRGYLVSLLLVTCSVGVVTQPQQAHALEWSALWQTEDQRGQAAFEAGDFATASKIFKNPDWQRAAAYRAGEYAKAASDALPTDSPQDHYNRANALALSGDLAGALEAYDTALASDPNHKDAQYNRDIIKNLLDQQNQSQNNQEQDNQQQNNQQQNTDKAQQNAQNQQNEQQDSQAADNSSSQSEDQRDNKSNQPNAQNSPENTENSTDENTKTAGAEANNQDEDNDPENAAQAQRAAEEELDELAERQRAAQAEQAEQAQAEQPNKTLTESELRAAEEQQQALERVIDDPGGLLRRKFILESRRRQRQTQAGEPVW